MLAHQTHRQDQRPEWLDLPVEVERAGHRRQIPEDARMGVDLRPHGLIREAAMIKPERRREMRVEIGHHAIEVEEDHRLRHGHAASALRCCQAIIIWQAGARPANPCSPDVLQLVVSS